MTASSELDLKQRLARLSERDRRAMSAYLLRLKHETRTGRQGISRLMGDLIVAFWPDDAVKELRIVEISEI